jgi:polyisoprenoid-binding protein YceI
MKKALLLTLAVAATMLATSCGSDNGGQKTGGDSTATNVANAITGDFNVDAAKTIVGWTGSKVAYSHVGTVKVQSGTVHVENGNVSKGEFTIDMSTIMENGKGTFDNEQKVTDLVNHLKAEDFFDVAKFPTSKLVINNVTAGGENGATHTVNGDLTIKSITKPITFPAKITVTENNVTASAAFKVNRAQYDIKYGSGTFFQNLGDKLINDDMDFTVELVANK